VDFATSHGKRAVIVAVGDILLGDAAAPTIEERGYDHLFAGVQPTIAGADLLMGNLETAITRSGRAAIPWKSYNYRMDPAATKVLRQQGFDLLVLANNHVMDYGSTGLTDTLNSLKEEGLLAVGAGKNEQEARRGIVVRFANGRRLGVLTYLMEHRVFEAGRLYAQGSRPGAARASIAAVKADVRRLGEFADDVLVQFHFGMNYQPVTPGQESLAHAAIDAGAALVIGHHPHIAHPVEIYRGCPILYSVGNFVFGTPGRFARFRQPGLGLVTRFLIGRSGLEKIEIVGLRVDNQEVHFQPRPLTARELKRELLPILRARGARFRRKGNRAVLRVASRPTR
jgi:poly-gamma-glutamate synthesis protein (capsule biosynthesis protein)